MANRYQDRPFPAGDERGRSGDPYRGGSEGDPLAELARLIGQTDPFANLGRDEREPRRGAHEPRFTEPAKDTHMQSHSGHGHLAEPEPDIDEPAPSPPSWMQRAKTLDTSRQGLERLASQNAPRASSTQQQDDHYEPGYAQAPSLAGDDHGHYRDQQEAPEQYSDPGRYDDALFGQMPGQQAQAAYPEQAYTYQDEFDPVYDEPPKRRGGLATVAVVVALAVVGTGAAFAYRTFIGSPRSGEPPVIRADAGPNKVVPPSANADAKLIQDRLSGSGTEQLVSREEQPVNVQDNTKAGPRVVFPPLNQNSNPPSTASVSPNGKSMTGSGVVQNGEEPRRIRTLTVRGDQMDNATPAARQAPARITAPAPVAARNAQASSNAPIALTPQTAASRVATTASVPQSGGYLVQVASQRSEAEAMSSFRVLKGKYPSVLGSRSASIKRADLGDKGVYYRAMIGPFGSPEEASQFCGSLKSAGGQCVVQRN